MQMAELYAVIMAGGRGERFWPLSTNKLPKPFIPLLGARSLLQDTVARIESLIPRERVLVSIGSIHLETAQQQLPTLPGENFIVEPVGRDTSACIGLSALHVEQRNPHGIMLALPADHFVSDVAAFVDAIQIGLQNLEEAAGVVFGIVPVRPETGYGYILAEKSAVRRDARPVIRFIEKPNAEAAARYLASGDYFWNSGMFLWKNRTLLGLFQTHMPETYRGLQDIRPLLGERDADEERNRIFSRLPRISIDYGIMEKTSGLRLVPSKFGWDDIGNWASLERAFPSDSRGNIVQGSNFALESNGCIVYAQSDTIAAFGVSDLVIVQAYGKILVCPKEKAADLKRLVTAMGPPD
jgi:mannose-1-phosphate guanylyltransferase